MYIYIYIYYLSIILLIKFLNLFIYLKKKLLFVSNLIDFLGEYGAKGRGPLPPG